MKFLSFVLFISFHMITTTFCHRINSKLIDKLSVQTEVRNDNSLAYVKASIPIQIFQCTQQLNILKCMKIFILQRMEHNPLKMNSGNITADFISQLFSNQEDKKDNIFDKRYVQMSDSELNERLTKSFQDFFKNREIKLHFIPGITVKVVPSAENAINFSLKKALVSAVSNEVSNYARARRTKPYEYLVQFGVPAMALPAVLMGTVLPFLLPAIKMATLATGTLNIGALLAAIMYAAKSTAFSNEKSSPYYPAGYHREMEVPVHFN
ncbi:hypothetical protein Bhyg_05597 [Pseudolycoriella hygida]|uniref:Uncharacterized protein n=1 Tax=Pseudolycoriella hygida TaxID=35572 RepID=A0A9Q0MZY8_9DIPT|nr:hypothetical protein Bhyg_05597 [Pseudolycoriella hygida]